VIEDKGKDDLGLGSKGEVMEIDKEVFYVDMEQ
jgi:hypothetical protein